MKTHDEVSVQHWLYPVNRKSRFVLLEDPDTDSREHEVTRQNIWDLIESDPQRLDSWYLATGYRLMQRGDALWIVDVYPDPEKAVVAIARVERVYEDSEGYWHADLIWNLQLTRALRRHPVLVSDYGQRAMTVTRANDRTTSVLEAWLDGGPTTGGSRSRDGSGRISREDRRTRALREVAQRQGQQVFRRRLIDAYGGRCAVTGSSAVDVLEAAHIASYLGAHSNVVRNGMLLRADIHTLFDLGLIAIDGDYRVKVSSKLNGTEYEEYRGKRLRLPKRTDERPSRSELNRHAKGLID